MRQGPDYRQRCERDKDGRLVITVPLELTEIFEDCECVSFYDDGTGRFHLRVFDKLVD